MKAKNNNLNLPERHSDNQKNKNPDGYPSYPASEDIYSKFMEEKDIDPENISKTKDSAEKYRVGTANEKDFNDDFSGSDLDIPGSELDDGQEIIGSEDEENNYYSLGGDDHDDLDEDQVE